MFTATDPNQIRLLTDDIQYYDVQKVNAIKKENKYIKEVVEECVLDPSVLVKDISMTVSGQAEDDIFLGDP